MTPPGGPIVRVQMPGMSLYDLDHKVMRLRERGWYGANRSSLIRAAIASLDVDAVEIPKGGAPVSLPPVKRIATTRTIICEACGGEFASQSATRRPKTCATCRREREAKRLKARYQP